MLFIYIYIYIYKEDQGIARVVSHNYVGIIPWDFHSNIYSFIINVILVSTDRVGSVIISINVIKWSVKTNQYVIRLVLFTFLFVTRLELFTSYATRLVKSFTYIHKTYYFSPNKWYKYQTCFCIAWDVSLYYLPLHYPCHCIILVKLSSSTISYTVCIECVRCIIQMI